MGTWIFSLTFLCLALVSGVHSLKVVIPELKYEFARGDNITLPCTFTTTLAKPKLIVVTWTAEGVDGAEDEVILTHYSHNGETDYTGDYENRAKLDVNLATGKADLKLSSITLNDNRRFECRLQIQGDDEGTPADLAELIVLVAPSTPICKIQGKAEYGQNINLTCRSEEGSPAPTYKWENKDVNNMPRMNDPRTTDKGGILSLYNISKDSSGYYICTSANKIRSASCNITLAVMPPSMLGSVGQTAGIIAGVVGLFLALILIIYCCCCKKKKGKDEEYAMGHREEEYRDKPPTENGEQPAIRDDDRSESDTRDCRENDDRRRENDDRRRDYDDRRSDYDDRRSDYNDRRSDYNDRRSDYNDRRSDFDDRRSDFDDRRSDYTERRSDFDDRRSDFDDRRSDYTDRRSDYDRRDRYDDERRDRRYDDDRRYDSRDRRYDDEYKDKPAPPANKPPRRDN